MNNSGCCLTSWNHTLPYTNGTNPVLSLTLRQDGAALSGSYQGLDRVRRAVTGTITGDRGITLRTTDGSTELTGAVEWREAGRDIISQYSVTLRLAIKGGGLDGQVFDFLWNDPF